MTLRQKILKAAYPLFVSYKRFMGENKTLAHNKDSKPAVSFYSLTVPLNDGSTLPLENLKGRKLLIVNTASDCGYTNQYAELQKLHERSKEDLMIIGFPSNDFKHQEKGSDEEIARFCQINFGVSFPLAKKSGVVKGADQNKIFEWLTHKELNGWNDKEPSWNFSKYLIDEEGNLTHYFDPSISPLSDKLIGTIHK